MDSRIPVVLFAQTPPPEHGQSRMVLMALEALRGHPESFEVHHVNARFSNSLEDIGESSFSKLLLTAKYLARATRVRFLVKQPLLYYVPGPVKWSSVLRDWILLGVLRMIYPRTVLHWHAIGHGEWAHGSDRLALRCPHWIDIIARAISRRMLDSPYASIVVSDNSAKDATAVRSGRVLVVCNGIEDPCPDFDNTGVAARMAFSEAAGTIPPVPFRILFLSHGTEEKGVLDSLECMRHALARSDSSWRYELTFAGGISETVRQRFDDISQQLRERWPGRLTIHEVGYVSGQAKQQCFASHAIFLAPSRWESFGLTVVEAMAHGMPIVAAASDGVSGVLPQYHPYLAPVAEPELLAGKLIDCCRALGGKDMPTAGIALRQRFLSNYQIHHFTDKLVSAFLELGSIEQPRAATNIPVATSPAVALPQTVRVCAYLADQNPGHDRSFGISRMSHVVLEALQAGGGITIETVSSKTSQQAPSSVTGRRILPWGTRSKWLRLLTDHFHPLFSGNGATPDVHYFPKGYLPLLSHLCRPSVVTIHDTIIQYDEDHYPNWRNRWEYAYWAHMLKHTLRHADRIMTVSESSKGQIEAFMDRHGIPRKPVTVTYEPCHYECVPQPESPEKENFVIHLASCEPHKRTAHLIRWWHEAETRGQVLPMLHLIGTVPPEVEPILPRSRSIVKRPFLEDSALQAAYRTARALVLPSEIEGFGLPALEAYYLGTPVCYVKGTSVEEILSVATAKGGFSLDSAESLFTAMDEVMRMSPEEVRECGIKLRETYAGEKVVERMMRVFREVKENGLKIDD